MAEKDTWLVCDNCGKVKESAKETVDPYKQEIEGRSVARTLCNECYELISADI